MKESADPASLRGGALGADARLELDPVKSVYLLGRSSQADIRLTDTEISRRHAEFCWSASRWILRDLGSRNGSYLNGSRIQRDTELRDGDHLRFGRSSIEFSWPSRARVTTSQAETEQGLAAPMLSNVELELLRLMAKPFAGTIDIRGSGIHPPSNAELADALVVTEGGIRQRLKRLYPKFGLTDNAGEKRIELVARAVDCGAIRLEAHGPPGRYDAVPPSGPGGSQGSGP